MSFNYKHRILQDNIVHLRAVPWYILRTLPKIAQLENSYFSWFSVASDPSLYKRLLDVTTKNRMATKENKVWQKQSFHNLEIPKHEVMCIRASNIIQIIRNTTIWNKNTTLIISSAMSTESNKRKSQRSTMTRSLSLTTMIWYK